MTIASKGNNNTHINVVDVGGGVVGNAVDVVLTANTGARVTLSKAWTQLSPARVSAVEPNYGQQGTRVVISGSNLLSGGSKVVSITLAGVSVDKMTKIDSNKEVHVVAGEGSNKTGAVIMITDTGAVITHEKSWTYITAGKVADVVPNVGQKGTAMIIKGNNLLAGGKKLTSVRLGSLDVQSITAQTNTEVSVIVGNGGAGTVPITLTADTGAYVHTPGAFSYLQRGQINQLTPNSGIEGTRVALSGRLMLGGGSSIRAITFGGVPVEKIVSANNTDIHVVTAKHSTFAKDVTVTIISNTGAVVTQDKIWTYASPGNVLQVTPNYGQLDTKVMISGKYLLGDGRNWSVLRLVV